jgi:Mrp family chromosome partitioning ATPase
MTTLDQAFIKAFSQQGVSPVALPPQPDETTAEARPSAAAPKKPTPKKKAAPAPISNVFRDVLATLKEPPSPPAGLETKKTPPVRTESRSKADSPQIPQIPPGKRDLPAFAGTKDGTGLMSLSAAVRQAEEKTSPSPWAADSWQTPLGMPESVCFAESICIAEPIDLPQFAGGQPVLSDLANTTFGPTADAAVAVPSSPVAPAAVAAVVEPPHEQTVQPTMPAASVAERIESASQQGIDLSRQQTAVEAPPAAAVQAAPVAPAFSAPVEAKPAVQHGFKPAWQVDRFTWPRVCRRLMDKANQEFDRLTDALMAVNARGQKVLAMAGCHRGEGTTTLLLCAARRLAERGVRLAVVDADLGRPRVAKRLGIQPQVGWNEASDAEGTPLDHAVVEATSNGLALASVRDPVSPNGHTSGDWSLLASCLETLKDHYEMVLVDLGPLENIGAIGDALGRVVEKKIDAVLLVHNGRTTSAERLSDVQQALTASGIAVAGVIENFVAV